MDDIRRTVDAVYREESRRVLATLIRLLRDFDLAEEAMHEAFRAAIEQWPREGVPANPRAWLVSAGRFKGIDRIRKRRRSSPLDDELAEQLPAETEDVAAMLDDELEDDRLRLIFTCCHPALPPDARIALTLREVCGLTTEEIARAFLAAPSTLAQRIVRAKNKIKVAGIPYVVPSRELLPERLDAVLRVIYLVFNEGYAADRPESLQGRPPDLLAGGEVVSDDGAAAAAEAKVGPVDDAGPTQIPAVTAVLPGVPRCSRAVDDAGGVAVPPLGHEHRDLDRVVRQAERRGGDRFNRPPRQAVRHLLIVSRFAGSTGLDRGGQQRGRAEERQERGHERLRGAEGGDYLRAAAVVQGVTGRMDRLSASVLAWT
jgi:RNA polymerase sigma factor (sigma-70 family)